MIVVFYTNERKKGAHVKITALKNKEWKNEEKRTKNHFLSLFFMFRVCVVVIIVGD